MMKKLITRKLTQQWVLLARKLDEINFLNLSWTKLSSQTSLTDRLQADLDREESGPIVEAVYTEEDHEEVEAKSGYTGVPLTDEVHTPEEVRHLLEGMGEINYEEKSESIYRVHKRLGMPFKWIPSCAGFKVELEGWDWLFSLFGREVRNRNQEVKMINWRNGRANRHLFVMFLRLSKLRDRGDMVGYWKLGWKLMRSRSYVIASFNYVYQNWARNMTLSESIKIVEGTLSLCKSRATNIKFHRTYIPKKASEPLSEENARPLGVPSPSWRVYLHMLNNLIVWSRSGKEGTQHAYIPGRGVLTAWQDVMANLPKWDYVYEFDLKGYFDNVSHRGIEDRLLSWGWSHEEVKLISGLMKSLPKLKSKDLLPEPDRHALFIPQYNPTRGPEVLKLNELFAGDESWHEEVYANPSLQSKSKGVPQGAAISCSLSSVASAHLTSGEILLEKGQVKLLIVMYADDGIIFSNSSLCEDYIKSPNRIDGVSINETKSGWIKFNGAWRVDSFKFLGLRYVVPKWFRSERIEASTRKGSTLKLTWRDLLLHHLLVTRDRLLKSASDRGLTAAITTAYGSNSEEIMYGGSASHLNSRAPETVRDWIWQEYHNFLLYPRKLQLLFGTKWSGYFLSGLYLNSWSHSPSQDFALKAKAGSWCEVRWAGYRQENYDKLWDPSKTWQSELLKRIEETQQTQRELVQETAELMIAFQGGSTYREIPKVQEVVEEVRLLLNSLHRFTTYLGSKGKSLKMESQIRLNIWNASSFGCDDLLRNQPEESLRQAISKELLSKGIPKEEKLKEWEEQLGYVKGFWENWRPYIKYYYKTKKDIKPQPKVTRTQEERAKAKIKEMIKAPLSLALKESNFQEAILLGPSSIMMALGGLIDKVERKSEEKWQNRQIQKKQPKFQRFAESITTSILNLLGGMALVTTGGHYFELKGFEVLELEQDSRPYRESQNLPKRLEWSILEMDWQNILLLGMLLGVTLYLLKYGWEHYRPPAPPDRSEGWGCINTADRMIMRKDDGPRGSGMESQERK